MGIIIPIIGDPIPWQRPGHRMLYGRIITYDKQSKEKEMVRWQLRSHFDRDPFPGPVRVCFKFKMPIPKSASRKMREQMLLNNVKHMKRPDLDNLEKFYMDCMTGIVYRDDCQVWGQGESHKVYSEQPGVIITVIAEEESVCI